MWNRVVAGDDDVECAVDGIKIAEIGDSESDILTKPSSLTSCALDRPLADVCPENAIALSGETDRLSSDPARAVKDILGIQPTNATNQSRNRQALTLNCGIPVLENEVVLRGKPIVKGLDRQATDANGR